MLHVLARNRRKLVPEKSWVSSQSTRRSESDLWGGSAWLWEVLLDKFAQACWTNKRELQIRASEVDMSSYWQLWLHSNCWAAEQPTETSANGLQENYNKFCLELMRTCAERWITCSWIWKWFYVIRAFCCQGAAQEGLQSLSCPSNNPDNSWFHFPFSHPLPEPGVGVLSKEDGRDEVAAMSLQWPRSFLHVPERTSDGSISG